MDKGAIGIQQIQFLRWCDEVGVSPTPETVKSTHENGSSNRDDARKPMFVSFDSYHLVDAFRRSASMQGQHVIMSEVLVPAAVVAAVAVGFARHGR
jgi:hypothetical protein